MNDFTHDWTSNYTGTWTACLGHLIDKPKVRGLEIGCFEGRSSCWFADHILTGCESLLDCVDPWPFDTRGIESTFDRNVASRGRVIRKHRKSSQEFMLAGYTAAAPHRYDFIYVDGNHRGDAVLADLALCWPLLRPGGVLICDDYLYRDSDPPPKTGIDGFFANQNDWHLLHKGYQWIARKSVGVEAVVSSVDYSDYLAHTLPMLVRHVDRVVVVTTPEDEATARVVNQTPFAKLVVTDRFSRNGALFNKGAAINDGLRQLSKSAWVLFTDADIALTDSIPVPTDTSSIWGANRRQVVGLEQFREATTDGFRHLPYIENLRLRDGYAPIGYFQLWHWSTDPRRMPEWSRDASRSDIEFSRHWPSRRRRLLPAFDVLHLEMPGDRRCANWRGRVTRTFGVTHADRKAAPRRPRCSDSIGILTAANADYWPTLRLLVEAAVQAEVPLAVVDHGLRPVQIEWLHQQGVELPELPAPQAVQRLVAGRQQITPPSPPQAWLKPWLCKQSPFELTLWIDSDAVPIRGLDRMLRMTEEGAWLTLESWIEGLSTKWLYEPLFRSVIGHFPKRFGNAQRISTGVFGFHRDDHWVSEWWQACLRILSDPDTLLKCRLRDQAALVLTLCTLDDDVDVPHIMTDRGLNWPVNGRRSGESKQRKRYPWRDADLLHRLRADHPDASVVHWVGTPKPWQMS